MPAYLRHDPAEDDPLRLLETNEKLLLLQHAVAALSPEDRQLCAAAAQRSLFKLAQNLHTSYRTVKRGWQRVLGDLRRALEPRGK
jgi:DNA-directed RNA polymerase specialized sigma24 family protein